MSSSSLKELPSYQDLQTVRQWLWGWIVFLAIYLIIWQWPSLTMVPLQHTFLLSLPSPGSLISEWWSRDHYFTLLLMVMWAVPLTLAFASESPLTNWRRTFHLFVVFGFFLVSVVIVFFWAFDYEAANDPTAANAHNPANDPRWCCVNFALAPQRCAPLTALNLCNPGVGQADLIVAPMFVYRFWFLAVFILFLVLDFFVMVKGLFERAVSRYYQEVINNGGGGTGDDEESETPLYDAKNGGPSPSAPPLYNAKGEPYCPYGKAAPAAASIGMKEHLRTMVIRQQQLGGKYNGKNSKR